MNKALLTLNWLPLKKMRSKGNLLLAALIYH